MVRDEVLTFELQDERKGETCLMVWSNSCCTATCVVRSNALSLTQCVTTFPSKGVPSFYTPYTVSPKLADEFWKVLWVCRVCLTKFLDWQWKFPFMFYKISLDQLTSKPVSTHQQAVVLIVISLYLQVPKVASEIINYNKD